MNKIRNIIEGWLKHLRIIKSTSEEKMLSKARLDICKSCLWYNDEGIWKNIGLCKNCLCALKPKTLIKKEHCPINKWW